MSCYMQQINFSLRELDGTVQIFSLSLELSASHNHKTWKKTFKDILGANGGVDQLKKESWIS